jgi:cobalt/nickel transport system permease protein
LYVHSDSRVHGLPPECKVASAAAFVFAVVLTPPTAVVAFAVYALLLYAVARVARVPVRFVLRRLTIEIPFLLFAIFLPVLASGPRIEVVGIALSEPGLWAAWNIIAKATLGLIATLLLAATTPVAEILFGLERLKVPKPLVTTAGFMVRYGDLIAGEMRRMKIARESRGYAPRWLWQARALASGIGTLFVRSYERGERVYLAMLSRGYAGSMPAPRTAMGSPAQWLVAMSLPAVAGAVAIIVWSIR